jgi:two-component system, response regulator
MNRRSLAILMVEDNLVDEELTLRALRKHKVTNPISVARDGEEALDYVYQRGRFAAHAPIPALILLDLRLPKLDGIEVLREIKAHSVYRTVPVVMLTTSQEEADVRTSYELGANSFLAKPVDFENFQEIVRRIDLFWLLTNLPPVAAVRLQGLSSLNEIESTDEGFDSPADRPPGKGV